MKINKLSFGQFVSSVIICCCLMVVPVSMHHQSVQLFDTQSATNRYESFISMIGSPIFLTSYIIIFIIINVYLLSFIFSSQEKFNVKIRYYQLIWIYNILFGGLIGYFYWAIKDSLLLYILIGYVSYLITIYIARKIVVIKQFVTTKLYQLKMIRSAIKI